MRFNLTLAPQFESLRGFLIPIIINSYLENINKILSSLIKTSIDNLHISRGRNLNSVPKQLSLYYG